LWRRPRPKLGCGAKETEKCPPSSVDIICSLLILYMLSMTSLTHEQWPFWYEAIHHNFGNISEINVLPSLKIKDTYFWPLNNRNYIYHGSILTEKYFLKKKKQHGRR
jgi:hypothetical protein